MRKFSFYLLILTLFGVSNVATVTAAEEFNLSANVEYKFRDDGTANITSAITIKNKSSNFFPKKFNYKLSGIKPNNISVYESGRKLQFAEELKGDGTNLSITFPTQSIGLDQEQTFVINFEANTLVKRSGEVVEVTVPKLENPDTFADYKLSVSV